ncbi:hypothetical protein [Flaviaesturariibacter amylovorans]|uniref:Uncharacterized protein n=1 Tax=Flaviaesturariibacter amylovorans TaxID=1084520 RepID=A0ABP8GFP1_9BACT
MKKILMSAALVVLTTVAASAQHKKTKGKTTVASDNAPTRLTSTSANAAFSGAAESRSTGFSIADPKVNFLNGRAAGVIPDERVERPVINMPKLRYGIARGHLLFYNTTAPTMGSFTGTGSVGTGSSIGSVGTSGRATGVNGKNPYAGPGIYGNRVGVSGAPVNLPPTDTRD